MEAQKKTISQAENAKYQGMKNEASVLFKNLLSMQQEKKENILVIETLEKLDPKRKAWRSVGGVIVERTVGEVIPALNHRNEELTDKIKTYQEKLDVKQKEIFDLEKALGIVGTESIVPKEEATMDEKKGGQSGVLV